MILSSFHRASSVTRKPLRWNIRCVSTLPNNPFIYVFSSPNSHTLSFLPNDPPTKNLSIGTTTQIPPTPNSFTENPTFLPILHSVLSKHAASDPLLQGQAAAFATNSASPLGFAGGIFSSQRRKPHRLASSQSNQTSCEQSKNVEPRGGWIHVSDLRAPPDYGRIAWPEDIIGSLEVDGNGNFIDNQKEGTYPGNYQPSGTYRIVTNNGILQLSDFIRQQLIERLSKLEKEYSDRKGCLT